MNRLGRLGRHGWTAMATMAAVLLVCGLCALAVQNGAEPGPRLRLVLPAAWALGGALGLGRPAEPAMPWSTTLAFTLVGLLVALALPLALAGGAAAVAVLTTVLTLALRPPHPGWMGVGLRVAGSWIAASGLLSLGWLLKGPS